MTRRDPTTFRQRAGRLKLSIQNMIRRVTLGGTDGGMWGIAGYDVQEIGGAGIVVEGEDDERIPVFAGLYVYARPKADDNAEAVIAHVGSEADHPTIVALRNEDARKRFVSGYGDIEPGEFALFNSDATAGLVVRAGGVLEIMGPGGTTEELVKKSGYAAHAHPTGTGPSGPPDNAAAAIYTTILKGQ